MPKTVNVLRDRSVSAAILVVDHHRTSRDILGRRLTQCGYSAALSTTGADAFAMIAARDFDLVLLDMTLPDMSGMQMLREIRLSRDTADLPVIALTAQNDGAAAVEALAAGADDHVAKPFDFDLLAARVARALARARRLAELKRANATLDARIATRAIELGEANSALAVTRADRQRLIASVQALSAQVERLSGTSALR